MGNRSGQAVVLAYVTVLVLTVLGGSLLTHSFTARQHSQIRELHTDVFYMAEGGIEAASSRFAVDIANFQVSATVARYPAAGSIITNFADGGVASTVIVEAEPTQRTIIDPDGVSVFVKNYHVTTTVQHPQNAGVAVTMHQIVARKIVYAFQHAVFYDGDLEWLPGPDMTLSGRVHSNNNIYLGANNLLTIDSEYLRAMGQIFNRRKDDNSRPSGIVQIRKAGTGQYAAMDGLDSASPTWTSESQTRWLGTVKSGVHGVQRRAVPLVGSIAPGGFYDSNADVKIVNGTITDRSGNPLVVPPGTVRTTTTFYNNREGKWVQMTEIDLRKLSGYADGDLPGSPSFPNRLPPNGLIYTTNSGVPSSQEPGVRLVNGAEIGRAGGLTVVSNAPIYIQGDFNTVAKKPAAVIGDAVNLLSNNWNDANSNAGVSSRPATQTTINTAFIAGIDTTSAGRYNGGLENYPRLHENWGGQELRIRGSFVSLWNSQVATGYWQYGNPQYTAPIRNWSYEGSFSDGANLPPFTPWSVEMAKGAWWKD